MLTIRNRYLDLERGSVVLDLGCGEGRHVHGLFMEDGVTAIGVDLDMASLFKARDGLTHLPAKDVDDEDVTGFTCASALSLPFADNTFDAVICSEVLEHIADYPAVLAEFRRILKPGGRLAVSVPHRWTEVICWRLAPPPNGYPFAPGGHIRIFEDEALKIEIETYGFTATRKHHAHGLHTPWWWLQCAFWQSRDTNPLAKAWHRMLVWDIMKRPWITRALDTLLSPFIGKSVVLYFHGDQK